MLNVKLQILKHELFNGINNRLILLNLIFKVFGKPANKNYVGVIKIGTGITITGIYLRIMGKKINMFDYV